MRESEAGREWIKMWEEGDGFREVLGRLRFQIQVWTYKVIEEWVDEKLAYYKTTFVPSSECRDS